MRFEIDEATVTFTAETDVEARLLEPVAEALNASDKTLPARVVDNMENGPEHRIINGVLLISTGN